MAHIDQLAFWLNINVGKHDLPPDRPLFNKLEELQRREDKRGRIQTNQNICHPSAAKLIIHATEDFKALLPPCY